MDPRAIAARLEAAGLLAAAEIAGRWGTGARMIPAPFLADGAIAVVRCRAPSRPIELAVGLAGQDGAALLSGDPAAFLDLCARAGLRLDTPERRAAYLDAFLEATRRRDAPFQVLRSADEIAPRPGLSAEAADRHRALVARLAGVIRPPALSEGAPCRYRLFALEGRALVEVELELRPDGRVRAGRAVIEDRLPVTYSL